MQTEQKVTSEGNAPRRTAADIRAGDVVYPPERELKLWMRRHIQEKNLPEHALHLNVREVSKASDKGGEWVIVKAQYPEAWGSVYGFTFKARPSTPWRFI